VVEWSQVYPPVSNQYIKLTYFNLKSLQTNRHYNEKKKILAAILNTKMPSMSSYQSIELLILKRNDKQAIKLS